MTTLKKVVIIAGGTGGHVFPGLAVANVMRAKGVEVHWLGTAKGIESKLVPEANIPFHEITISGLRGKGFFSWLLAPFRAVYAIVQSYLHIREQKPDLVLGLGGFVSGPGGVAAWLAGCPLVIHEQNAKPGLTNRWLLPLAKRVLQGFPNTFPDGPKVFTVGNPVRPEIEALPGPDAKASEPGRAWRLLVIGGSLGAHALNAAVPEALSLLPMDVRPDVVHQTGGKHIETTKTAYDSIGLHVNLVPFMKDMAQAYAWADMVLCRAGALTVAELCAVGLGAVFVPYPHSADGHQAANADFMVSNSAAVSLPQAELTPKKLAGLLRQFAESPASRLAMAKSAYRLRNPNVADKIYTFCEEAVS
jgi:UDP-N-acetylglucosamine--N-acetylmuramyl-(pentapeptide) pyrophosphoryl-undecaprenol N-acetylglucosamine transferase